MEHYEAFFILPEAESGDTWEVLNIGGPSIAGVVSVSAQQVVDTKADRDRLAAENARLRAALWAMLSHYAPDSDDDTDEAVMARAAALLLLLAAVLLLARRRRYRAPGQPYPFRRAGRDWPADQEG